MISVAICKDVGVLFYEQRGSPGLRHVLRQLQLLPSKVLNARRIWIGGATAQTIAALVTRLCALDGPVVSAEWPVGTPLGARGAVL